VNLTAIFRQQGASTIAIEPEGIPEGVSFEEVECLAYRARFQTVPQLEQ
jgi:hypothetical protein